MAATLIVPAACGAMDAGEPGGAFSGPHQAPTTTLAGEPVIRHARVSVASAPMPLSAPSAGETAPQTSRVTQSPTGAPPSEDEAPPSDDKAVPLAPTAIPAAVSGGAGTAPVLPDSVAPAIPQGPASDLLTLRQVQRIISSNITPKSIVHSGTGLFFAQNMMYRHSVTVYDRHANLVATIDDTIIPADHGLATTSALRGAPVEASFTSDGRYGYVSNYRMSGPGYTNPGHDGCSTGSWDESYLYRIDTDRLAIDQVIAVGAVPKYVEVTPDDQKVLVTNWCGFDVSIIDTAAAVEINRVHLGRHPRGIAISPDSRVAYIAVMGSSNIAVLSLDTYTVGWIEGVGANPRHVVLSPDGTTLYATLNGAGTVARIDIATRTVTGRVRTGNAPRSMEISADGRSLYVVNYESDTLSKVATDSFRVIQTLPVADKPIGVTFDPLTRSVWVSSYSGAITVFADRP